VDSGALAAEAGAAVAGPAEAEASVAEVPVAAGENKQSWSRSFIKDAEAEQVAVTIGHVEKKTSGEIVPMIVRRSSAIGHVPYLLTLIFWLALMVFEIPQYSFFTLDFYGPWILAALAIACFLISFPLSKLFWIQRMLVPHRDQVFQVNARALLEFYQTGIINTHSRTGVFLFLSLMERKAVVLADEAIAKKMSVETWKQICQEMVDGIQKGETGAGMVRAIEKCGDVLAPHFPPVAGKQNELKDALVVKE
jgi:putative membrane protein